MGVCKITLIALGICVLISIITIILIKPTLKTLYNYYGSLILDKGESYYGMWFRLRLKHDVFDHHHVSDKIYVTKYEWNQYEIGDNIK